MNFLFPNLKLKHKANTNMLQIPTAQITKCGVRYKKCEII